MTVETDVLRLHSRDLLSKWGFNDGSMPDDVFGWVEDAGIDRMAVDWPCVLEQLVREHLLPLVERDLVVVEVVPHNPIRAEFVDGLEIDWYAIDPQVKLTPEYVDVPRDVVLAACRATFV